MNPQNNLLRVTDLSSYLYCPRKFYIEKIIGLRQPPSKKMIEGGLHHRVREKFSDKEQDMIENLSLAGKEFKPQIKEFYKQLIQALIRRTFENSQKAIKSFNINEQELGSKIFTSMKNEILLRVDSIDTAVKKGFKGKELWENLEPKWISEMPLLSESIGLKGRADRVMISEKTIIPFELKTRPTDKIWPSDEVQLTAYTMLLEEKFKTRIPLAILESGNTKHELIITPEMKQKVKDLIKEVKQLYKTRKPKFPPSFSKCQVCDWGEECEKIGEES